MLNIETPLSQGSYGVATLEIHRFEHNWKDRISVTQFDQSKEEGGRRGPQLDHFGSLS